MDFPLSTLETAPLPQARGPVAIWLLIALIGVVLGGAALAGALATDTRDYAVRHATVLATRAL